MNVIVMYCNNVLKRRCFQISYTRYFFKQTLEKTEGTMGNEQSRDPGNIGHKTKDEEKKTQDRKIPIE